MSDETTVEAPETTGVAADHQTTVQLQAREEKPRRRGSGLSAAVLFIGLGVLLLLNNVGVIDVNFLALLRYWPILLIVVGLDLILGRQGILGSAIMAVVALALIAGVIVLSLTSTLGPALGGRLTGEFTQAPGRISALEATLDLGIVEADIAALEDDALLFDGSYSTPEELPITVDYSEVDGTGILTIQQDDVERGPSIPFLGGDRIAGDFTLGLQRDIPIDLSISVGIGDTVVDLTGLTITSLQVGGGIGSLEIILPATGSFTANFGVGIGDMQIWLPESMEAYVNYDGGIASLDTVSRLGRVGEGQWATDSYDGADDYVELNIDAGIGSVDIHNR